MVGNILSIKEKWTTYDQWNFLPALPWYCQTLIVSSESLPELKPHLPPAAEIEEMS